MPVYGLDDTKMEFGPEALVFDRFGNPIYAPLPGEPVDEEGRPVHRLMQAVDYEPENPLDCPYCGGLYDLRFWEVKDDEARCPECSQTTSVDDLVANIEERQ